ncbi:MAG: mevalonate kinase [Anaerolineae bacterium]|nr:mevalonate kinase [Anaerolineae bacterium]
MAVAVWRTRGAGTDYTRFWWARHLARWATLLYPIVHSTIRHVLADPRALVSRKLCGEVTLTCGVAPGKVILLGEHAVVYGRPAIAVPVTEVRAVATVEDTRASPGVTVYAPDIGRTIDVACAPADEPLSFTVRNTLAQLGLELSQVRLEVHVHSTIPVASGLGSGAAVATALVRALGAHLGSPLPTGVLCALVYETERIHHGTPSGVDNTVVSYAQPVLFRRGAAIERLGVRSPFWLAIADTGVPSLTRETVAHVRAVWERERAACEQVFDRIGTLVDAARATIEAGHVAALGRLMDENQALLRQLGVSSPELERLIDAAHGAGALGAKLSGGGRGGNAIALLEPARADEVARALTRAGARNVIVTKVGRDEPA